MTKRTITGKIHNLKDFPIENVEIIFELSSTFKNNIFYPSTSTMVLTDTQGNFTVDLWCNEEGSEQSVYTCYIPHHNFFKFTIPIGTTPIDLGILKQGGITPISPQYQTLITYLLQQLSGSQAYKETFTTSNNQLQFNLSNIPSFPHLTQVFLNGVHQNFGTDYNINSNILNWLSNINLKNGWILEIYY